MSNELSTTESVSELIAEFNSLPRVEREHKVKVLAATIIQAEQSHPEAAWPNTAKHHFSGNLYAREYLLGKSVLALGRKHKTDHIAIVAKGDVSVISDDGWVRLREGSVISTKAGSQRIVFGHEDTVFVTVHEGKADADDLDLNDPTKMMDVLADNNACEFLEFVERLGRVNECHSLSQQS